jgi:hypothetical protein
LSQKRNSLRTFAIVLGLFLAGIPLAFLLAGQSGDGGGNASVLIFLLFLASWTAIGTLLTRLNAKGIYWSFHVFLWVSALIFGSIVSSELQWFPGWLALLFPIGGSLFLATLYRSFMGHFSGKIGPQPTPPYQQSYQQGYQPTLQNSASYPAGDSSIYPSQHEQPHANYPQSMTQ